MNPSAKKDRIAYKLANDYLTTSLKDIGENYPEKILNCYRKPSKKTGLRDIYHRLLESAQNRQYGAQIDLSLLRPILCNFDPNQVIKKYPNVEDHTKLLKDLIQHNILKKSRQAENYCKTIISGATFLTRFDDGKKFTQWASIFGQHPTYRKNPALRAALPALLSYEIQGFGFALACDFIKEIGYEQFGKPDKHLHAILGGLDLIENSSKDKDLNVFRAIVRIAKNQNSEVTAYAVDKLFWLIGSANFYNHSYLQKKKGLKKKISKEQFIEFVKKTTPAYFTIKM